MTSANHLVSRYHCQGDADAFCALVRDHGGMVFATAKRVTGDAALAEDVAQETFLELARQGHHAVESVAAWLHRVAWRKACDVVRSEVRRRRHEKAAAETQPITAETSWEDLEPLIDEVLEELPADLRESLVKHYLEGHTQQELASWMGVSQSTVSRQLDAGIRALRSRLRAKGLLCGAGLAALLSSGTAQGVPSSLTASLGKLAISGVGASAPGPPVAVVTSAALVTMKITEITLATLAAVALMIGLPFVLLNQGDTTAKPKSAAAPSQASALQVRPAAKTKDQTVAPRHSQPAPVPEKVRLKVDAMLHHFRGMSRHELEQDDEFQKLMASFGTSTALDEHELERKFEEFVKGIKVAKGMEHGMIGMDMGEPDSPEFRTWLEFALSDDPHWAKKWYQNRLEGALFEFALDPSLRQTSSGIIVDPAPPTKAQTDGREQD